MQILSLNLTVCLREAKIFRPPQQERCLPCPHPMSPLPLSLQTWKKSTPCWKLTRRPAGKPLSLSFVSEGFDAEYEEDLLIEDIAFEGGRFIIEFQSSTELCNEITHTLFEGLSEKGGKNIMALEYNSRIGTFSCMVPGYDEAEYADDCFDDFDGMMHDLEEIMDRREQLLHILELTETEPVRSSLRELLGEEDDEELEVEVDEVEVKTRKKTKKLKKTRTIRTTKNSINSKKSSKTRLSKQTVKRAL